MTNSRLDLRRHDGMTNPNAAGAEEALMSISEVGVTSDPAMVGLVTSSFEKKRGEIFRSRCHVMPNFQKTVSGEAVARGASLCQNP